MIVGTNLRNWGPGSERDVLLACAEAADQSTLDTIWVNERLSLPPDSGWSSSDGGRFLDTFLSLAFVASRTSRIGLGTGVINAPYHVTLQLIKQVSTLQDLSGGRLRLGVGVGWHEEEFRALGVDYRERGRLTTEALSQLKEAFETGAIRVNGAELPLLPAPERPPIYVGGGIDNALRRAARYGDGWIASGLTPDEIAPRIKRLEAFADEYQRDRPHVIAMKTLPLDEPQAAIDMAGAYREHGVDEFVHGDGYDGLAEYEERLSLLDGLIVPAVTS